MNVPPQYGVGVNGIGIECREGGERGRGGGEGGEREGRGRGEGGEREGRGRGEGERR